MRERINFLFLLFITLFLTACTTTDSGLAKRPQVQAFIQHVSTQDHFNQTQLENLFNQVYVRPVVIHHTQTPRETSVLWDDYRHIFLQPKRIAQGVSFIADYQSTFTQAQQTYGVPPSIIAAIIGVETEYGQVMGKYRVIDALSTLAFNYHHRTQFFQTELEQYLLLTRDLNLNPLNLYGSYAGAVGLPQFMPDSYRQLAVSAIPGKTPDLWHNPQDAILSVGNFFYHKSWVSNAPIVVPAIIKGARYKKLDFSGFHTKYTIAQLKNYGILSLYPLAPQTPVNLIILPTTHGEEYWLACHNFYVITHYNTSIFYAMAVSQLAEAIAQRYHHYMQGA